MSRRRVTFTDGMTRDKMLIITDAPAEEIVKWCIRYLLCTDEVIKIDFLDTLKSKFYVRELLDSSIDGDLEDIELLGYDEAYDLSEIYRVLMEVFDENGGLSLYF